MSYANKDNYNFTPEEADELWVDTFGDVAIAKDAAGKLIMRNMHGKTDSFGWEIDHIWPKQNLKEARVATSIINSKCNLRPLNWKTNKSRSTSLPEYISTARFLALCKVLFPNLRLTERLQLAIDWLDAINNIKHDV